MSEKLRLIFVITFLSFKIIAHAYLLKVLMMHKKNQNSLLYLLMNFISSR